MPGRFERVTSAVSNAIATFLRRHWFGATGLFFLLAVLSLWQIPQLEVAPLRKSYLEIAVFEQEDRARATLAQIIGGAVVLAGLWFTWQRIEISRQGQITERFTRAVEQLGSAQQSIRVGATFALERIARESEQDRWSIIELLAAFIRDTRPVDETLRLPTGVVPKLPADVQSALVVIGRLVRNNDVISHERYLDLEDTDLRGASLDGLSLPGAKFTGAWLDSASLRDANLERATFLHAKLKMADLSRANLRLADFEAADAQDADFSGSSLAGARLKNAQFQGADLNEANVEHMLLESAHLEGADLRNTHGIPFVFPVPIARVFVDRRTQFSESMLDWLKANSVSFV